KHMETKKCKKCQKIIAGDIYRISTTEYEARSWKKKGEKYKSYCQPCYEKLPIGVRPYDCKGNDKCQSCGATKECGAKKCNNKKELELDGNRLCNDCRVSNKKKWDGLLNCNVCSRRVKTLFTSSGQAGGDMCANCYARTCEKCGASMRGFENNIPNKVAESKIENLNLSLKGKKTKKPFLICQHCNSDIPLWKYHNEVNYKNDIDAEIAICHAKHVRDCSSAPFLARSKANAALDKKNYDGFYFTESGSRGQGNRNQENGNPNGNQKGNDGLVKGILIVGLLSSLIALGIYALKLELMTIDKSATLAGQKEIIQERHEKRGFNKWNKEDCGNALHRKKVFYKTDGLLPYEIRKGLMYEVPNWELISELLRRICNDEIDPHQLAQFLEQKKYKDFELEAINELINRLDTNEKVKDLEDWAALKIILTQHKELARAKTYCFVGTIVKKTKEKFRETNEGLGVKAGDEYIKLELDLKLPGNNRNLIIYCAWFNLDDPTDYQKDVVPCMTGETYEFEILEDPDYVKKNNEKKKKAKLAKAGETVDSYERKRKSKKRNSDSRASADETLARHMKKANKKDCHPDKCQGYSEEIKLTMKDKKELCGRIAEGEFLEEEISSYLTDKELLKELEDGEEYNEEILFYKLFPSRKERKEAKTGSWRNILMKDMNEKDAKIKELEKEKEEYLRKAVNAEISKIEKENE
ncbi:33654_t:CDS:10, partial [Gigaspora margarita]